MTMYTPKVNAQLAMAARSLWLAEEKARAEFAARLEVELHGGVLYTQRYNDRDKLRAMEGARLKLEMMELGHLSPKRRSRKLLNRYRLLPVRQYELPA
jgi:hypothetical protein